MIRYLKYGIVNFASIGVFAFAQSPSESAIQAGFDIIYNRNLGNCVTCHTMHVGGSQTSRQIEKQGNFGPELSSVGSKYTRQQLTAWVTDARKIHPQTMMPPYGSLEGIVLPNQNKTLLSDEQIQMVVDALSTLKSNK